MSDEQEASEYLVSSEFEIIETPPPREDGAVWSPVWGGYMWRDESGVLHVDRPPGD